MSHKLKLDIFEGPLDLLLYLIKKNDIDIHDIPISEVTEQYMEYIEYMKMLDLDLVGDFLVMASTLMQIKSKMLLPPDPSEEEPVDPREELVQRLSEYEQFKHIAEDLNSKSLFRQDLYPRTLGEDALKELKADAKEVMLDVNLFDLINALTEALKRVPDDTLHEIEKEEYTIEKKIHDILHRLLDKDQLKLSQLFSESKSKMELIVSFMAVLELIRLKEIKIVQKKLFDDIEIYRNRENIMPVENEAHE